MMAASFSACTLVLLAGVPACSGNESAATKKTLDSLKLVNAKTDSLRKAAYRNHDLSIIFLEATSQLLQCQLLLEKADAGLQKRGPSDSLLVNSKKGDTLYRAINKMYDLGTLYATNETDKKRFMEMKTPDSSALWLQKHFKGITSVEAVNTLSKIQNDCILINKLVQR